MVPEVSFLNRSAPITFPEILEHRKLLFKVFMLCKVSLTVWVAVSGLGTDYSCMSGVQQRWGLSCSAPLHFSCRAIPPGLLLFAWKHPTSITYVSVLVHSWLRKVSPGGICVQAAAEAQPGLVCMAWAGLRECQALKGCSRERGCAAFAFVGSPAVTIPQMAQQSSMPGLGVLLPWLSHLGPTAQPSHTREREGHTTLHTANTFLCLFSTRH